MPPFPEQHQEKPGLESRLSPRPQFEAEEYRAAEKLRGKVALVTGGDSGIGRAVAVLYAREGCDVAITSLPQEESDARETLRHIEAAGRRSLLLMGDLTQLEFIDQCINQTVQELGGLNILVNNAAFQQHQPGLEALADEQWDHTFKTNITGTSVCPRRPFRT